MVKVPLKGVAKVRSKGRVYWYVWRGGPRLAGEPGSPEFMASYHEAHEQLRAPDGSRFHSLIAAYKASPQYQTLAASTREHFERWFGRVGDYFGELSVAQFERPEKIRPIIRRWRNQWADKPRAADYGMQVLSAVLGHAVDPLERLSSNPCIGIKRLYDGGHRSEIIWTDADIARLKRACSAEIAHAVDLAAHTGLRRGDLVRVAWSHIGDDAIVIATGKSGGRRQAIVPLYDALKAVLAGIPKRATTVLTNPSGRPWSATSLSASFNRAKHAAGMPEENLHFHDLRGTAATRFYVASLPARAIAEIMGWEEAHVDKIIRRYVARSAATRAIIRQLNERKP
jgi:integrase